MAIYSRSAKTTYSRSTGNLLVAESFSTPQLQPITSNDLFTVMETFFGTPPLNSTQLIDQTVLDFILWISNYLDIYVKQDIESASVSIISNFRGLLTLPLLWFQPNGLSFNVSASLSSIPLPGLPPSMTVTASLAETKGYVALARWTAYVYIAVASVFLCTLSGILFVTTSTQSPTTSAFSVLDFSSRVLAGGTGNRSVGRGLLNVSTIDSNDDIQDQFKSTRVFLRGLDCKEGHDVDSNDGVIGFTTDHTEGSRLRAGGQYVAGGMHNEDI